MKSIIATLNYHGDMIIFLTVLFLLTFLFVGADYKEKQLEEEQAAFYRMKLRAELNR